MVFGLSGVPSSLSVNNYFITKVYDDGNCVSLRARRKDWAYKAITLSYCRGDDFIRVTEVRDYLVGSKTRKIRKPQVLDRGRIPLTSPIENLEDPISLIEDYLVDLERMERRTRRRR